MKFIGIIPSRYKSTRFPGKPLAMIGGMTMIERVYRQASLELDDRVSTTRRPRLRLSCALSTRPAASRL